MLLCASTFLTGIWLGDATPETFFKFIATFFVVGLASFLIWLPMMVYRFLQK